MLLKAVDSEDAPTLEAALPVLGVLGLRSVAPRVLALVRHPSQSVRRAALGALPFLDPAGAEEVARAALGSDVEPSVRAAAAQVLGDVGTARSASALNRAAREDPDSRVKFVAGDSLRKLGFHVPSRSPNP
jgi:HEAT repeat protein